MDRRLSILVVEDDPAERAALSDCIEAQASLSLVGATGDEARGLEMVTDYLPDVVVLDLALGSGSGGGFGLMRSLRQSPPPVLPYILVTTSNTSGATNAVAHDYGADYVLSKYQRDYSAQMVVDHILTIRDTLLRRPAVRPAASPGEKRNRLRARISAELDAVGINPKRLGRRYLEMGIYNLIVQPELPTCAAIAAELGKTEQSVDNAIKGAIHDAWKNASDEELSRYTARISPERGAPTSTEFICHYANKLRHEYD